MDYHKAIAEAWDKVQNGHGTQTIIGKEGSYDFRVATDSVAVLHSSEYRAKTITAWPTPAETEL